MNYTEFCNLIRDMVQERMGEDTKVGLQEVLRNNGVCLHGLTFMGEGTNMSPTIYLESYFYAYGRGTSLEEIVKSIVEQYHFVPKKGEIDMSFFKDFDRVKEKIAYRLVNRMHNEKLLSDIPFIPYLDLAICFFYAYDDAVLGEGSILIRRSHMEMWNTDVKELFALAQQNTPKLYPKDMIGMNLLLEELMQREGMNGDAIAKELGTGKFPMFVLTNKKRMHGAAVILYPDLLEQLAAKMGKGFYIIPSSVHEVIIIPYDDRLDSDYIKWMIYDINHSKVEPEEVLSDSLYAYNKKDKRIIKL